MSTEIQHGIRVIVFQKWGSNAWAATIGTTYDADAPIITTIKGTLAASGLLFEDIAVFTGPNIATGPGMFRFVVANPPEQQFEQQFDYTQDTAIPQLQEIMTSLLKEVQAAAPIMSELRVDSMFKLNIPPPNEATVKEIEGYVSVMPSVDQTVQLEGDQSALLAMAERITPRNKSQSRLFLDMTDVGLGPIYGESPQLTDAEYFARKAQMLSAVASGPLQVGYQLYCLSESLRIAAAFNPDMYAQYGEALRADPILRNVFYQEPIDASDDAVDE